MGNGDEQKAARRARTIRVLMTGLGLFWGANAYAQDGAVPDPALGDEPGYQIPAEGGAVTNGSAAGCNCDPCQCAAEEPACDCLMRHFDDDCGNNWLEDRGLRFYGWIDQGFSAAHSLPDTTCNKASRARRRATLLLLRPSASRDNL